MGQAPAANLSSSSPLKHLLVALCLAKAAVMRSVLTLRGTAPASPPGFAVRLTRRQLISVLAC